ncbi:XRE family transcriptional regulator [Roseovarius spongiae]|uniref:XRE family transcriptional regulator n=2 Tax=Roseovarius spongiae TaxID=2320272 RepID=A0A3A8AQX6_9RHOB|nr:XRE family transcriptional regulator [Roseovarius spongiae]
MKLRIQLGLNIQEVRRSQGISQEGLAHLADIDRGYIGKIENAKHAATVDMIEAIAKALCIEPMELLKPRS